MKTYRDWYGREFTPKTKLEELRAQHREETIALSKQQELHRRLPPAEWIAKYAADMRETADLVSRHAHEETAYLATAEGRADYIAERIAIVRDHEECYRKAIERPDLIFMAPRMKKEDLLRIMRERQAIYAEFITIYEQQGPEAFVKEFERSREVNTLAFRLQQSDSETMVYEKVAGDPDRRGDMFDGGHWTSDQLLPPPILKKESGRQGLPDWYSQVGADYECIAIESETYEAYVQEGKACQQKELTVLRQHADTDTWKLLGPPLEKWRPLSQPEWAKLREKAAIDEAMRKYCKKLNERQIIEKQLEWILVKVLRKRYDRPKDLAAEFNMPVRWVEAVKACAIGSGKMTEDEWNACFNKRGRPKAVKKRGPYKKKQRSDGPPKLSSGTLPN